MRPGLRVNALELAVGFAAAIVVLDLIARRLPIPRPVVLAAGGMVLGLFWRQLGLPAFQIAPDLVLGVLLPPLLAAAAFRLPLGVFRANLRPIIILAVGLVVATMAGVAAVAHAIIPGLPWAAAFALGAIVAPPDPVAATSVAHRLGLSNRMVTILEGEGLINDATALVAFELAVAAAVTGHFSWVHAGLDVVRATAFGVATGLLVGWITVQVRRRVDDTMIETAVSLMVPYAAWVVAERFGGSGVLAVVTFGIFIRGRATEIGAPGTRLVNRTVWRAVDFLAGGVVFALVGIELGRVAGHGIGASVLGHAAVIIGITIAIRLAWMWGVPQLMPALTGGRVRPNYTWAELTVVGWAGLRGVVTLALAIALPVTIGSGEPFPARTELVIIALAVVLVTLIGAGVTLAPLIQRLGVGDSGGVAREEREARGAAIAAARRQVESLAGHIPLTEEECHRLVERLGEDLGLAGDDGGQGRRSRLPGGAPGTDVVLAALAAERATIQRLRNEGRLNDGSAAQFEAALDLEEMALRGRSGTVIGG